MDYSLMLGIHDTQQAENDDRETEELDEDDGDDEYDSGGSGAALTPPDSPQAARRELTKKDSIVEALIDPERDIYAIPSQGLGERHEIYFLSLVDILTHYGVKKMTAKAAKTVKYGANSGGIRYG